MITRKWPGSFSRGVETMDQFLVISDLGGVSNFDSIKISGAVISAYLDMYPDRSVIFSEDFKMQVTDAFPFNSGTPYLPTPIFPALPFKQGSKIDERIKAMKSRKRRPQFVSIDTARAMANAYAESGYTSAFMGSILDSHDMIVKTPNVEEIPGVKIDPVTQESEIYTKEVTRYETGAKLWIHMSAQEDDLLVALVALQDSGISSRRSVGFGRFRVKGIKFNFSVGFSEPGLYEVLSPYIPEQNDLDSIDFEKSSYTLSLFSGNDMDGAPLTVCKYFDTGSVLYLKRQVKGSWVEPKGKRKRLINFKGSFLRLGS